MLSCPNDDASDLSLCVNTRPRALTPLIWRWGSPLETKPKTVNN